MRRNGEHLTVDDVTELPPPVFLPQPWARDAVCAQVDGEAFFPAKGKPAREAKQVCQGCSVRAECLEWAIGQGERWGIWGGLTTAERDRLQRGMVAA